MRVENLKKEHFDTIFRELLLEKRSSGMAPYLISTFDLADKLWEKFRLPYKKQAEVIREKMRAWWSSYEWRYEPRPHKLICGVAVFLSSPMSYDYCMLEKSGHTQQSLICIYQNQGEFRAEGGN